VAEARLPEQFYPELEHISWSIIIRLQN